VLRDHKPLVRWLLSASPLPFQLTGPTLRAPPLLHNASLHGQGSLVEDMKSGVWLCSAPAPATALTPHPALSILLSGSSHRPPPSTPTGTRDCKETSSAFLVCPLSWSSPTPSAIPVFGRLSKKPRRFSMLRLEVRFPAGRAAAHRTWYRKPGMQRSRSALPDGATSPRPVPAAKRRQN
jgi:hypothetical protein